MGSDIDWNSVNLDNMAGDMSAGIDIANMKFPLPPGLLGQMYSELYEMQIFQHIEFSHVTAIGMIAGIAGRRFNVNKLGLNMYLMILADTASGKDFIGKTIRRVLSTVSDLGNGMTFIGGQRFTAGKGLADELMENRSQVCVFTEAGMMAKSKSGDPANLTKALLSLYTMSGFNDYTGKEIFSEKEKGIKPMRSPALTLVSESTPSTILDELHSGNNLDNGLLPRQSLYRIISDKPYPNMNSREYLSEEILQRIRLLVEECKMYQNDSTGVRIRCTNFEWGDLQDDMHEFWKKCIDIDNNERRTGNNSPKGIMAGRMHVKAMKYAAICTLFNIESVPLGEDCAPITIDRDAWNWAKNIVVYELANTLKFFEGSNFINPIEDIVKNIVGKAMFRMLKGEFTAKSIKLTPRELENHIIPFKKLAQCLKQNKQLMITARCNSPVDGLEIVLEHMIKVGYINVEYVSNEGHAGKFRKGLFNANDIIRVNDSLLCAIRG
jgi:hypothetical protein